MTTSQPPSWLDFTLQLCESISRCLEIASSDDTRKTRKTLARNAAKQLMIAWMEIQRSCGLKMPLVIGNQHERAVTDLQAEIGSVPPGSLDRKVRVAMAGLRRLEKQT